MNYGYLRVSTNEQNVENQRLAIENNYKIDKWIFEKKSGTIDYHKRNLGDLILKLQKGDILIVTEISRLGRSITMIFNIINELSNKGVRIIAIKNGLDLNPLNGNNIVCDILLFAFGLSAQIERELISERTKQGLNVARMKGKRIGRQKGEIPYNIKLRPYEIEIKDKVKKGSSINFLAKEYDTTWVTMKKFIERINNETY